MTWAAYEPFEPPCSGGPMPGTSALAAALLDVFPAGYSLGIYNCRPPSIHGDGRAFDLGLPMIDGRANPIGYKVVALLKATASPLGITEAIFDRKRWSQHYPDGIYYGGISPHYDHVHIGQSKQQATYLTYPTALHVLTSGLGGEGGGEPYDPPGEDDMPDNETIKQLVREVLNEGTGDGQTSWAGTSKATLAAIGKTDNDVLAAADLRFIIDGSSAQWRTCPGGRAWLSPEDLSNLGAGRVPLRTVPVGHWLEALPVVGPTPPVNP